MAKRDPMFNKKAIGAYQDRDASFLNRTDKAYWETNPPRPIWRNVDKNQDVNKGAPGGIPYGTDK